MVEDEPEVNGQTLEYPDTVVNEMVIYSAHSSFAKNKINVQNYINDSVGVF